MAFASHRFGFGRLAAVLLLSAAFAAAAFAQERADCSVFRSTILHTGVPYCVYLPVSYSRPGSKTRRYPVLYSLHGLGSNEQEMALSGEWDLLQDLRKNHKVGEFLVVAPNGFDSFFVNSWDGKVRYSDFFLREFMPFIEKNYRIRPGRAFRGITGISMGGYGAIRLAFAHPDLFGSVSAHSAALMRNPPRGVGIGAADGSFPAEILTSVFGNPIDRKFWDANSPFLLARKNAALLKHTKIYFDCGTEDSYGFDRGATELHRTLDSLGIPHEFHLYPGGHNLTYFLAHWAESFEFHWRAFESAH